MIPLAASWLDSLTRNAKELHILRLLFSRSTQDPLESPPNMDDYLVRISDLIDDHQQIRLSQFTIEGLDSFRGPKALGQFLHTEATEHFRWVLAEASRNGEHPPRRIRAVLQIMDGDGSELDEVGAYIGFRPVSTATKQNAAGGLNFAEDAADAGEELAASPTRINRQLETGYLGMVKTVGALITARVSDSAKFADATYANAIKFQERIETNASADESEDGMDDEITMAGLALLQTMFGQKNERKEKAETINSKAPKDGKAGGPACAYAREALTHFNDENIAHLMEAPGFRKPIGRMLQVLRYAEESNATDAKLLKDFKDSAEWFIGQYQKDPRSLMRIPRSAAPSMDALLKLSQV